MSCKSCKCIMFRDESIRGFFKFPFCGGLSLHLHKMVEETSRELKIFSSENFETHVHADINISCLLNGRKHRIEEMHKK